MAERSGFLGVASRAVTVIAGLGSVALTVYAGRGNHRFWLMVMFAVWVATPFAALLLVDAKLRRKHETTGSRDAMHWLMIVVSVVSVTIYSLVALKPAEERAARMFVLVPAAASVLAGAAISAVAFIRTKPRRG